MNDFIWFSLNFFIRALKKFARMAHFGRFSTDEEIATALSIKNALKTDKLKSLRRLTDAPELCTFKFQLTAVELPEEIQYECPLLISAIYFNATKSFGFLTESGVGAEATDGWRVGPLHMSARMGFLHFLQNPYFESLDFAAQDWRGQTPAHYASAHGRLDCLRFLIEDKHCDVNTKDKFCMSLLHIACENGQIEIIRYLFDRRVEIATDNLGRTPLGVAAQKGQLQVVRLMGSQNPAILTQIDDCGRSLLHLAAASGLAEEIELLKAVHDLNPNALDAFGMAPIHYAASRDLREAIAALLTFPGVDKTLRDADGDFAIHIAARFGAGRALSALISPNTDENSPRNAEGKTPLILAVENGQPVAVLELVRAGASETETDGNGMEAKFLVKGSLASVIRQILDHNWDFAEDGEILLPYVFNGIPVNGKDRHGHRRRARSCNVA
jgi:ankyrin repeat protein